MIMKTLITTIFLLATCSLFAQDLIVTGEGDSVNCRITKIQDGYVFFTYILNDEVKKTVLRKSQIKTYNYKFYDNTNKSMGYYERVHQERQLRINIDGGLSYLTAPISENIPSNLNSYMQDIKSGYQLNGSVQYFISENLGFGLKGLSMMTYNQLNGTLININGSTLVGTLRDDILVVFVGPSISSRFLPKDEKNSFVLGLSMGYIHYTNNAIVINAFKLESQTVGLAWDIAWDYKINNEFGVGLSLSYTLASLTSYKMTSGGTVQTIKLDKDNYESINHFAITIGLRLYK